MVQITIGGNAKFSKTHFESLEEFLIEVQVRKEPAFELTDEQKKILDERLAYSLKHPNEGKTLEDFMKTREYA